MWKIEVGGKTEKRFLFLKDIWIWGDLGQNYTPSVLIWAWRTTCHVFGSGPSLWLQRFMLSSSVQGLLVAKLLGPHCPRLSWSTLVLPLGKQAAPSQNTVALPPVTPSTPLPRGGELKSYGKQRVSAATSSSVILCFYSWCHLPPTWSGGGRLTWVFSTELQSMVCTETLSGHSALVVQMKIKSRLLMWGERGKIEMSPWQLLDGGWKNWAQWSV